MELLVLVSVVLLLACVLRWSLGDGLGGLRSRKSSHRRDYGLLVEIATAPNPSAARMATEALRAAGIRATTAPAEHPGYVAVLVFGSDGERARAVLLDEQWPQQQS